MRKYITGSEGETRRLAKKIAKKIKHGVVALTGELGAGKTTFVQGFAQGLGIKEKIISPTFVLIRQHPIPKTSSLLYHIDLYRLEDAKDFRHLGLEEILSNPNNLVLIEWAEKAEKYLPKNTIWISFERIDENQRRIAIKYNANILQ